LLRFAKGSFPDFAGRSPTLGNEPIWLASEEVVETNREAVELTGEPHFLRDGELLESALAKPRNHWGYGEEDIVVLAVKLLLGIARNHPFEQGNKRTAFTTAVIFLELNGYELITRDDEVFGKTIEQAIIGEISEATFTAIIRECVHELPGE
jgi:death-on-curing protein